MSKPKKLLGLPVVESDDVPPATAEFGRVLTHEPHDFLGNRVEIGACLLTARGELLTALETPPSIWLRGAGIAVEDRKGVKTYRPHSMLVKVSREAGWDLLTERERTQAFLKLTETKREERRLELQKRRGFKRD